MQRYIKQFLPSLHKLPTVVKTKRTILHQTNDVAVVGFQWKQNDGLPEHDHYGKCLFQVIEGQLLEIRSTYETVLSKGDIGRIDKGIKHAIVPLEDSISIHVYSPPPPCLQEPS